MAEPNVNLTLPRIYRLLKSERGRMADIARALQVSRPAVSRVLRGKSPGRKIVALARQIAERILAERRQAREGK